MCFLKNISHHFNYNIKTQAGEGLWDLNDQLWPYDYLMEDLNIEMNLTYIYIFSDDFNKQFI